MIRNALLLAVALFLTSISACSRTGSSMHGNAVITLNPDMTYQRMTGWEATAQAGQEEAGFENYREKLFDLAVNDLGINRVRLEIRSGAEHKQDNWSAFRAGQIDKATWKCLRYSTVNDNDDPFVINWKGFRFSELDHHVENVVLPLKQRVEANGEKLYINVNYVAFTKHLYSNLKYHHDDSAEEYAEFVLATFLHLKDKYNLIPDSLEMILEPDNTDFWSGKRIGKAIVASAKRLKNNGFNPGFVAPSNTNMKKALTWFDEMVQVPEVLQYLSEFSYHRYGGVSDSNLRAIADRAVQYGIHTAMLEHIGSGYEDLHKDLKIGRNSAWQQYTLAYPTNDNGAQYYTIDISNPDNPSIHIGSRTKLLRQYFKFIRSGAVRIAATSNNDDFDPLAFINTDGRYVVVIKAGSGGSFSIQGLPAGNYGVTYTTSHHYNVEAPDVAINPGEALRANIPEKGIITVYAKS